MMIKKFIILVSAFLFTISINAQHFQFMGIPIDGNIDEFSMALKSKGFKRNTLMDPKGNKNFKGVFANEKAKLCVFFHPTTKLVYALEVDISCYNASEVKKKLEKFETSIKQKYGEQVVDEDLEKSVEGDIRHTFHILDKTSGMKGQIQLHSYCREGNKYLGGTYRLEIFYCDVDNYDAYKAKEVNDL